VRVLAMRVYFFRTFCDDRQPVVPVSFIYLDALIP